MLKNTVGAYILHHAKSDLFFVGSSGNLRNVECYHVSVLRSKKHHNRKLQELFDDNQEMEFTYIQTESRLLAYEKAQELMDKFRSEKRLINVGLSSRNASKGLKLPDAVVQKMTKAKQVVTAETAKKISQSLTGKKRKPQERDRLRLVAAKQHAINRKPIQIKGAEYESITAAAKALGLTLYALRYRLKHGRDISPEN